MAEFEAIVWVKLSNDAAGPYHALAQGKKVSRGEIVELRLDNQVTSRIKGGHIVKVTKEEFEAYQKQVEQNKQAEAKAASSNDEMFQAMEKLESETVRNAELQQANTELQQANAELQQANAKTLEEIDKLKAQIAAYKAKGGK